MASFFEFHYKNISNFFGTYLNLLPPGPEGPSNFAMLQFKVWELLQINYLTVGFLKNVSDYTERDYDCDFMYWM